MKEISSAHAAVNPMDVMGALGALGIVAFVLIAIASFLALAPLVLQLASWVVLRYKPRFWEAFVINLKIGGWSFLVSFLFGLVLGFVMFFVSRGTPSNGAGLQAIIMLFVLPFQAWLYGRYIKLPETGSVGIGKGALIMLVQMLIAVGFVIGLVVVVMLMTFVIGLLSPH